MKCHLAKGQPVMIFFENLAAANNFYHSEAFENHQKKTTMLS